MTSRSKSGLLACTALTSPCAIVLGLGLAVALLSPTPASAQCVTAGNTVCSGVVTTGFTGNPAGGADVTVSPGAVMANPAGAQVIDLLANGNFLSHYGTIDGGVTGHGVTALGSNNSLQLYAGSVVTTTGDNLFGVNGGSNGQVFLEGTVQTMGANAVGISVISGNNMVVAASGVLTTQGAGAFGIRGDSNNLLNLFGQVTTQAAGATGVVFTGAGNSVTVQASGGVTAIQGDAIVFGGDAGTLTIQGAVSGQRGVVLNNATGQTNISIEAGGLLTSATTALQGGAGLDIVTLRGSVIGDISLGGGNDILQIYGGYSLSGLLDGGAGMDQLSLLTGVDSVFDLNGQTGFEQLSLNTSSSWTLTGSASFSQIFFGGGEFRVNGSLTGDNSFSLPSSGTISGTGTVGASNEFLFLDGTIAPGTIGTAGTLTMGRLVMSAGSQLNFDLGAPGVVGGGVNDLLVLTGNSFVLDGTLNVNALAGYGAGSYRLINYVPTFLTDNGLNLGVMPAFAGTAVIQTSIDGQINLILSGATTVQFWDGVGAANDGSIGGGSATWDNAATNWTSADGLTNAAWGGGFAVFGAPGGTVNLGADIAFDGMQFTANGYSITGAFDLKPTGLAAVRVDAGVTAAIAADITGTGGISKADPGTLILTGVNTYSGGTTVAGGILQGNTTSLQGAINNAGQIAFAQLVNGTFAGAISGSGSLIKAGAGVLTMTGASTFTGGTTITGGSLRLTSANLTGNVIDNSILHFEQAANGTFAGVISGSGELLKTGAGQLTLTGANTYSGGTFVAAGELWGDATSLQGAIVNNAVVNFSQAGSSETYAGVMSGTGLLRQSGPFILTLTGANTYSGGTLIAAGGLRGDTGSLQGSIVDNGVLRFEQGFNGTFGGALSGTGSLEKAGGGTVTLTGMITHTGGTNIFGGGLAGTTANLQGGFAVSGGAVLRLDQASNGVFAGVLSGAGILQKAGAGTVTLNGAHVIGTTQILAGGLNVTGSLSGNTTVSSGGVLSGTGSLGAVSAGGTLSPGTGGAGTLTLGSLLLGATANLQFDLSTPNVVGGVNDLLVVTGDLTLDGMLTVSDAGGFGAGSYRLINYGGLLTENGLLVGNLPAGSFTGTIQTAVSGEINLIVTAGSPILFWDGGGVAGDGVISGGSGIWNNANTNWTTADGLGVTPWTNTFAVFGGTGGGVTLADDITFDTMQFTANGYVVSGSNFELMPSTTNMTSVRVDTGVLAEIAAGISGIGGITKSDGGVLRLTGHNTYTGGTYVIAGVLEVNTDSLPGDVVNDATLRFNQDLDAAYDGVISGSGVLVKTGAGVLTLTGANTHTGGIVINAGVLAGDTDSLHGDVMNSAVLRFDQGFAGTFSGAIFGPGSLIKTGAGDLTLTGANAYTGGTLVTGGILSGDASSLQGAIVNNAAVRLNQASNGVYAGDMSGSGGLIKTGAFMLRLTGINSYTGGTTVAAGDLFGDTRSLQGPIINNGAVAFDQSFDGTYAGAISGSGVVGTIGSGTVTWTGVNTYTGGTLVLGGQLIGNSLSLQGDIQNDAIVQFNQTAAGTYAGDMAGSGALVKTGGGTLTLTGQIGVTGGTSVLGGRLIGNTTNLNGGILNNAIVEFNQATNATYAGVMTGTGALVKSGGGLLLLTGANTYSGGTTVAAGSLGGTTSTIQGAILNNGVVLFDQAANGTYAGVMTGAGGLVKGGSGAVVLTGANTYSGGTLVAGGTLVGDSVSLQGTIQTDASLVFNQVANGTFAGTIFGSGTVLKTGGGDLTFSGSSGYTGGTTISAGRLIGTTNSLQGPILNNAAVVFDQTFNGAFSGLISGTGSVRKTGSGGVLLTGAHTWTGATTLDQGLLVLNGSITSILTVNGGTFGGDATLGGLIVNGGTVSPGNSIGTITVNGAVNFSGGTWIVETSSAGASDRILATGATALSGGQVSLFAGPGQYAVGTVFNILNAQGGVTGAFAGATGTGFGFMTPVLSYGATSVSAQLEIDKAALVAAADTPNRTAVADAASGLPDNNAVLNALVYVAPASAPLAFDMLSGEIHASTSTANLEVDGLVRGALSGRFGVAGQPGGPGWLLWGQALGQSGDRDGDGNAGPLDGQTVGVLVGAERDLTASVRLGFALGTTQTDVEITDHRASTAEVAAQHAAIYASADLGPVRVEAGAIGSWRNVETERRVSIGAVDETLIGAFDSASVQVFAELSKQFRMGGVDIEPFAGGVWGSVSSDAVTETGGSAALTGQAADYDVRLADIGLRASYPIQLDSGRSLRTFGSLAWVHSLNDEAPQADLAFVASPGTDFTVAGLPLEQDQAVMEAGLSLGLGDAASVRVSWQGQAGADSTSHAAKAEFSIRF